METQSGRTQEERHYYDLNRKVYSWLAPFYEATVLPLRRLRHDVVSTANVAPDARVLDVATGTGDQARAFAERCREVVGIDLSEAMLRVARRKTRFSNVTFLRADATELPFPAKSFDVSCISFALHEMPPSIREAVLGEMTRVTKPLGTIVVVDYGLPLSAVGSFVVGHAVELYERKPYTAFIRSNLREAIEKAGIEIRRDDPALLGFARVIVGTRNPCAATSKSAP